MTDKEENASLDIEDHILHKEWDEISCPICMDHPHNLVLLICSSHEKGCRSYICDTSYRHSNCLDRFKNQKDSPVHAFHFPENAESLRDQHRSMHALISDTLFSGQRIAEQTATHFSSSMEGTSSGITASLFEDLEENSVQRAETNLETQAQERMEVQNFGQGDNMSEKNSLRCPLCRGFVLGYRIEKEVRQYLDQKVRGCSRESCAFTGNYRELRRHARRAHPMTRPADVDPSRRRAWRHLEREQEIGDVISALQSTSPGAIVIGDYVIDGGDGFPRDRENGGPGGGSRSWWTTFFVLQMLRSPLGPVRESRTSRYWRTRRRSGNRNLWDIDPVDVEDDDINDGFHDVDDAPVTRRRRRFMRRRIDDNNGHER